MPRSKTNRLRNAEKNGAKIVSADDGKPVKYDSKGRKDDKPWVKDSGERKSGKDCKAIVED